MGYPTLGSFVSDIAWSLGNRTDINDRISKWLRDAYYEIAMGYPLETLEETVNGNMVPGLESLDYPENARAAKSLTVFGANNQSIPVFKKNIEVVRRYQVTSRGVPAIWAPYGQQLIMRPIPNQIFPYTMDYWKLPNISQDEEDVDVINDTEAELPGDWFEILKKATTEKGYVDLEEFDKASNVRNLLNGDPNQQEGWPGMIKERLTRNAAENVLSNYGVRPRMRRYTR